MLEKTPLSTRDQILLSIGCALFFSFAIAVGGYMGAAQEREKIAAFAADAAVADGVVTGKRVDMVMASKVTVWWLQVAFKTAGGADRLDSIEVADSIYDRYSVNSPVRVTYVRSKPEWFYIPDTAPTLRDVAISDFMFKGGVVAGLASLLGLLFMIFSGRGGAPRANRAAPAPRAKSPVAPARPRGEFGTRGRA